MTSNQIAFFRAREEQRKNREQEKLGWAGLSESERHNRAQESIGWGNISLGYDQLGEAKRHNIQTESVNWYNAREQARSNRQRERISWYDAQSAAQLRAAQASKVGAETNYITYVQTPIAKGQYQLAVDTLNEQIRSNKAREGETAQHNRAMESYSKWQTITGGVRDVAGAYRDVNKGNRDLVGTIGDVLGLVSGLRSNQLSIW